MNFDLPVQVVIPGDPAALRTSARTLSEVVASRGRLVAEQAEAARDATAGGWHGPAGDAFGAATLSAAARARGFTQQVQAAAPVITAYADTLERLQRDYIAVQARYRELSETVRGTPRDTAEADVAGRAWVAAQDRLETIRAEAEAASTAAAARLGEVENALTVYDRAAERMALTIAAGEVGAGFQAAQQAAETVLGEGATATMWKVAGRALGPIGAGLSQAVEDTTNPNYSAAERVGRAAGQALYSGVPATVAGIGGAMVGGAVGSVAGPVGTFVGGFTLGTGAAYATSTGMRSLPVADDIIDASGEAADTIADTTSNTIGGTIGEALGPDE